MPSTSVKQARFMSAAAHNPDFARRADIPVKVAKDFHASDAGHKYGKGHDKKALRIAKRQAKKYARGGNIDDFDPTEGGNIPRVRQQSFREPLKTFRLPNEPNPPPDTDRYNPNRYADGGGAFGVYSPGEQAEADKTDPISMS